VNGRQEEGSTHFAATELFILHWRMSKVRYLLKKQSPAWTAGEDNS
jgi:hypothetical protein